MSVSKMFASRPILGAEWASEFETSVMLVQRGEAPVHERVRGQAGLDGVDIWRKLFVAFLKGIEAGGGAEHREVRRPGMSRNIKVLRRSIKGQLEQFFCIEAQDRPAVGLEVADPGQHEIQPFGSRKVRRENDRVDLPGPSVLAVDAADLGRENEVHVGPA